MTLPLLAGQSSTPRRSEEATVQSLKWLDKKKTVEDQLSRGEGRKGRELLDFSFAPPTRVYGCKSSVQDPAHLAQFITCTGVLMEFACHVDGFEHRRVMFKVSRDGC